MIVLQLTERESVCLENTVSRRLGEMLKELVHTDDRTAHAELKASYEELERLGGRLHDLTLAKGAPAASA